MPCPAFHHGPMEICKRGLNLQGIMKVKKFIAKQSGKHKDQEESREITEEEMQAAIRKFLKSGGMIRKLPDQKSVGNRMVGMKRSHAEMEGDQHG